MVPAGRSIRQTRGRVVGGSYAIDGMGFVRRNRRGYNDWRANDATPWTVSQRSGR